MLTTRTTLIAACTLGAALWISAAIGAENIPNTAVNTSAAMPGDEALSCEQIYAEAVAQKEQEQQQRNARSDEIKAKEAALVALIGTTMVVGAVDPTGKAAQIPGRAAQKTAENLADQVVATPWPQANPRMTHLRELWTQKHCAMPAASAAPANDAAMTCEQIATELQPYAQQMLPNLQAMLGNMQSMYAQNRALGEKRRAEHEALNMMATPSVMDPTGVSKRAYAAAVGAQAAKESAENEAIKNSPQWREADAQGNQMAAQGMEMQANPRFQQLMQLAQEKHCYRR